MWMHKCRDIQGLGTKMQHISTLDAVLLTDVVVASASIDWVKL